MAKDYDKIARSLGAVDYDALAAESIAAAEPKPARDALMEGLRFHNRNLSTYGGAIGAVVGSPALAAGQVEVPVGLAMLGAGAGKVLEHTFNPLLGVEGPAMGSPEMVGDVAGAAALGGVTEGAGQAVTAVARSGAGMVARQQMAKALSAAKPVMKRFDDVVGAAIRQGATVNRWGGRPGEAVNWAGRGGGAAAANRIRREATGRVVGLLRAATRSGHQVYIEDVAGPAIQAVEKKLGRPLGIAYNALGDAIDERQVFLEMIQNRADDLLLESVMGASRRSSNAMTPMMADELRKAAARRAKAALTAEHATGMFDMSIPDLDRMIAAGASRSVNRIRNLRTGQSVGALRRAEQEAIGVSRAITQVEREPLQAAKSIGVGPVHIGFGATPGIGSRLALLANAAQAQSPMIGPVVANLIRAMQVGSNAR